MKKEGSIVQIVDLNNLISKMKFNCQICRLILNIFLIIGRSLGQGTFGKVRLGTHLITGEKVAIKILEKDKIKDQSDVERVTREIHILKIVRHPNVI